MLRRNLTAAVIAVLGMMFTGNAFGQGHKDFPAARKNPKTVKRKTSNYYNPKEIGVDKAANRQRKQASLYTSGGVEHEDTWENIKARTTSIKSPRDVAAGQSSQKSKGGMRKTQARDKSDNFESQGLRKKGKTRFDEADALFGKSHSYIGETEKNITAVKPKAPKKEFSGTMMEGSNIRRKQPRKGKRP